MGATNTTARRVSSSFLPLLLTLLVFNVQHTPHSSFPFSLGSPFSCSGAVLDQPGDRLLDLLVAQALEGLLLLGAELCDGAC